MKTISKVLLGLLLIAPGLQAIEVAPTLDEITETQHLCTAIKTLDETGITAFLPSEKISLYMEQEINSALRQHKDPEHARVLLLRPAIHRNKALLKKLIPYVSMQRFTDIHGWDPIFDTSDPETMQLLLNHKANINARDNSKTRLIYLCRSQLDTPQRECVHLLLTQGIAVNAQDSNGVTALQTIIENGLHEYSEDRLPIVKKLLEHNADPYIETTGYITQANNVFDTLTTQSGYNRGGTWSYYQLNLAPKLVADTLALCVAQRPRRVHGLGDALNPYLDRDTAGIVIGYTQEGFEEETSRKAARTALTKTSE